MPKIKEQPKTGVYKFVNLLDGKVYVGSAAISLERRRSQHLKKLSRNIHPNRHFQKAWNEAGEQNFLFVIIEECAPEYALDREDFWLGCYASYDRRFGYNIMPTARISRLEAAWTEESREKVRRAVTELWKDPSMRQIYISASEEYWKDPEAHERHKAIMKEAMNRPETRQKFLQAMADPELRSKRKKSAKASWADPEKKSKRLAECAKAGVVEKLKEGNKRSWADPQKRAERLEKIRKTREANKKKKAEMSIQEAIVSLETKEPENPKEE